MPPTSCDHVVRLDPLDKEEGTPFDARREPPPLATLPLATDVRGVLR
jgi:hypothetical protein